MDDTVENPAKSPEAAKAFYDRFDHRNQGGMASKTPEQRAQEDEAAATRAQATTAATAPE